MSSELNFKGFDYYLDAIKNVFPTFDELCNLKSNFIDDLNNFNFEDLSYLNEHILTMKDKDIEIKIFLNNDSNKIYKMDIKKENITFDLNVSNEDLISIFDKIKKVKKLRLKFLF